MITKTTKRILCLILSLVMLLAFVGCSEEKEPEYSDNNLSGFYEAIISVKDMGDITLILDADTAPVTVTNFKDLADAGFYDGLTFHRVINGFMIQGGDPDGNGSGGSSQNIIGEFSANGHKNNISHKRGVISMARNSVSMDSASSQFFIVHQDSAFLDGQYAAFGYVTSGMEIVDKIATETPVVDDNGTVKAGYKPIIKTITVKKTEKTAPTEKEEKYTPAYTPNEGDKVHTAVIKVKDLGEIKLELNETAAPITVKNFVDLANKKFYDGLTFHRVINGFMIQGGDPKADGTGGSDTEIKGEFSANGVNNPFSHKRGVISMARNSISMDSASSQFFIVHKDSTFLDGQYAAFGYVLEGMEVVDKIAANTPVTDSNGTVEKKNQPIIESIKILD